MTLTSLFFIARSNSTGPVVKVIFASKNSFAFTGSLIEICIAMVDPPSTLFNLRFCSSQKGPIGSHKNMTSRGCRRCFSTSNIHYLQVPIDLSRDDGLGCEFGAGLATLTIHYGAPVWMQHLSRHIRGILGGQKDITRRHLCWFACSL